MKKDKTIYAAPTVSAVEFAAETVFAASETETANAKTISDWEQGNDDWFQY